MSIISRKLKTFVALTIFCTLNNAFAVEDLSSLSLDSLSNLDYIVYSSSKQDEKLLDANSAIYVLDGEDIKRSGVTHIMDALRMAPGVQVGKINNGDWAISARGFTNKDLANKLLVLMDGRSIYTPYTSGVYWPSQDIALEEIDRIEVIRGPGATLWGANAVNGVINIITKDAANMQESFLNTRVGKYEQGGGVLQKAGKIQDTAYRINYKHTYSNDPASDSGLFSKDDFQRSKVAFRTDTVKGQDHITVSGGHVVGKKHSVQLQTSYEYPYDWPINDREKFTENYALGSWERSYADNSKIKFQAYYDSTKRKDVLSNNILTIDIYDTEFQRTKHWNPRNELIWGAGARFIRDKVIGLNETTQFFGGEKLHIYNFFAQNKYAIIPDKLFFTIGSKFEDNSYTKFEYQPSVKLLYKPADKQTIWSSISRSVRTPSSIEHKLDYTLLVEPPSSATDYLPVALKPTGNAALKSEKLISYEIGYRNEVNSKILFDIATFYNDYKDVIRPCLIPYSVAFTPSPHIDQRILYSNCIAAKSWGAEIAPSFTLADNWKMKMSLSLIKLNAKSRNIADIGTAQNIVGQLPKSQLSLGSYYDVTDKLKFDSHFYQVGRLNAGPISPLNRFDSKLTYTHSQNLELSVVGQNIFGKRHYEFTSSELAASSLSTAALTSVAAPVVFASVSFKF